MCQTQLWETEKSSCRDCRSNHTPFSLQHVPIWNDLSCLIHSPVSINTNIEMAHGNKITPPTTPNKKMGWRENYGKYSSFYVTLWWITLWYGTSASVLNICIDFCHLAVTSAGLTKLMMQHLNKFSLEFGYNLTIFISDYLKTWHSPSFCHPLYQTVCALLPQTALVGHPVSWTEVVPCLSENTHS